MAAKRAAQKPPTPPSSSSSSGEDDASDASSSDEEQQQPTKKPAASAATRASKPKPAPPGVSSSDEEEEDDEEEEEDDEQKRAEAEEESEEEEEESNEKTKKQLKPPSDENVVKPEKQPQGKPPTQSTEGGVEESSDESGSDSESSEKPISARLPPRGADASIKPISSRPMDEAPPKRRTPPSTASPPLASSKRKPKAAPPEASEKDGGGSEKKRKLFERFWSEDDEVKILRGILDYNTGKSSDPSSPLDMDALHDFLRNALGSEFSKTQLTDKIRRLKRKYETTTARAKNGASPNFAKPLERSAYELSKKIWGPKENADAEANAQAESERESEEHEGTVPSQRVQKHRGDSASPAAVELEKSKPAMAVEKSKDLGEVEAAYPLLMEALTHAGNLKMSVSAAKRALASVDNSKAMALEEKFRKQRVLEMKHHLHWLELMKETVKLSMEGLSKSG